MVACCSFGVCERRERQPGKSAPPCLLGFVVVEGLWVSFGVLSSVVRGRRDERNRTVCVLGLLVAGVMAAVPAAGETERERGVMCVVVEEIVFLQEAQLKKIGVVLIILVVVTAATRDRRAAKQ